LTICVTLIRFWIACCTTSKATRRSLWLGGLDAFTVDAIHGHARTGRLATTASRFFDNWFRFGLGGRCRFGSWFGCRLRLRSWLGSRFRWFEFIGNAQVDVTDIVLVIVHVFPLSIR
jgi:hypothetical protein